MPVGVVVFSLLVAWLGIQYFTHKYRAEAEKFDLGDIEKMEAASLIYDRGDQQIGKIFIENRHPIPYSEFPKQMIEAVVAAEDNRFYDHKGVDYMGIARAAIANWRTGHIKQGASTVTQQVARNSFDLHERSYKRKLVEMFLAERIEKHLSKQKIMEIYLNRVYLGSGFYGAEAAARGYFGISAKDMDVGQCAMLAGLLKNPNGLSPWRNLKKAQETRDFVLGRMKDNGFITRAECKQAQEQLLIVRRPSNPFNKVSYAIDYVRQQAILAVGYDRAMNGGYRIYTTLDSPMQRAAEVALRQKLQEVERRPGYKYQTYDAYTQEYKAAEKAAHGATPNITPPAYLQGAVLAIENKSGGILTMVGGRDFLQNEYNRAIQGRFPTGTAFAPFVYAAAFEKDLYPGVIVQDAALDNRNVMIGGETGILGEWGVERPDNDYEGPITMRSALVKGKNAATVRVGFLVGLDAVKNLCTKAGITSPLRDFTNAFLGSTELSIDELTLAYSNFPNGGWHAKHPYIIQRIVDSTGKVVFEASSEKVTAFSDATAYQISSVLAESLRTGTGSVAYTNYGLKDFPAAGKTGTSYNFTNAYFIGYDAPITCTVWVGFDKPGKIYRGAFGKDLALPVWASVMNASLTSFPATTFSRPASLKDVEVSKITGLLANSIASQSAARAMGIKDDPSKNYKELATDAQIESLNKRVSSVFDKQYDENEWPRAAAAVDLATIPPIAVMTPPLLGFDDVYNALRPAMQQFDDSNIPVMKALPVDAEKSGDNTATPADSEGTEASASASKSTQIEIRKAEAVKPLDSAMDAPAIQVKPPEPIKF
ncbi:MAG: transglycosylase domain-containing protein [Chthoniobacterales bacterium]